MGTLYPFKRLLTKFAESTSSRDMLSKDNLDTRETAINTSRTHPVAGRVLAVLRAAQTAD
jgi:hypothetical protein